MSKSLSINLPAELVRRMRDIAGKDGVLSEVVFSTLYRWHLRHPNNIPADQLVPNMNAVRAELLKGDDE
jgi:hypothetical protein